MTLGRLVDLLVLGRWDLGLERTPEALEHGQVVNAVNFPAVQMARESPWRVAIANANVPNMLGQISTAMAQAGPCVASCS